MKYFTIEELSYSYTAEVNGIENKPNVEETKHLTELVDNLLDPFREYLGKPIRVNSGFRCDKLNKLVGGSATSAHRYGWAADIHCDNISIATLWQVLINFCQERGIKYDQIFTETDGRSEWIHVGYKAYAEAQRGQSGHWVKK